MILICVVTILKINYIHGGRIYQSKKEIGSHNHSIDSIIKISIRQFEMEVIRLWMLMCVCVCFRCLFENFLFLTCLLVYFVKNKTKWIVTKNYRAQLIIVWLQKQVATQRFISQIWACFQNDKICFRSFKKISIQVKMVEKKH